MKYEYCTAEHTSGLQESIDTEKPIEKTTFEKLLKAVKNNDISVVVINETLKDNKASIKDFIDIIPIVSISFLV